MIQKFLDVTKIMDYEITIYFITPSHLVSLFKDKHAKESNFLALFYGQPQ